MIKLRPEAHTGHGKARRAGGSVQKVKNLLMPQVPRLQLTITFQATEEHRSCASPEPKSYWRRKLYTGHCDLQWEEDIRAT